MNSQNRNTESNYAACPAYEAMLEDHLNGELVGSEASALSAHLQSCSGCRSALDQAVVSSRLLRLAEPTPDPGSGFSHMLMARIRTELHLAEDKSVWQAIVSFAWRFAASAAMVALVLVSFEVGRHNQFQQDESQMAVNRLPEIVPDQRSLPATRDEVLLMMAESNHGQQ
jgi:predicted anti-sigma-YlaC factor YlaD